MVIETEVIDFKQDYFWPQHRRRRRLLVTCSGAVVSFGELDLDLVLPSDVLDPAALWPHDRAVVALRDRNLHTHLGLLWGGEVKGQ